MNNIENKYKNPGTKTDSASLKKLRDIIAGVFKGNESQTSKKRPFIPPSPQPKLKILTYLKPVPWLLLALFLYSFYWDFENFSIQLFNWDLPLQGVLRIVSVSGMIGFMTNWIAITMLFRPLKRRPLLGQGLIPAQKDRIAYRLSLAVSEDLINPGIIRKKIEQSDVIEKYRRKASMDIRRVFQKKEFRDEIKNLVVDYVSSFLKDESVKKQLSVEIADEIEQRLMDKPLERTAVKTYMLFRGMHLSEMIASTLEEIPFTVQKKIDFMDEFLDEIPIKLEENSEQLDEAITTLIFNLVNRFDVQQIVEENLNKFDEVKLERMIQNATNEQLKTIQYLGAVLGTIGGFVIWQPLLSLSVLTVIGGTIYLTDRALFQ
jgi:uncharacterized membrane protein YheB (UPF0754 family)